MSKKATPAARRSLARRLRKLVGDDLAVLAAFADLVEHVKATRPSPSPRRAKGGR